MARKIITDYWFQIRTKQKRQYSREMIHKRRLTVLKNEAQGIEGVG